MWDVIKKSLLLLGFLIILYFIYYILGEYLIDFNIMNLIIITIYFLWNFVASKFKEKLKINIYKLFITMSLFSSLFLVFQIYEIIDYQVRYNSKVSKGNTFFSECDEKEISFFTKAGNPKVKVLRNCFFGKTIYWYPLNMMKYETQYYNGKLIIYKGVFVCNKNN